MQFEKIKHAQSVSKWKEIYTDIFDEDDLRLAQSQGKLGYKFYEWLSAITIYNTIGYLSLIEKYEMPLHSRKHQVFQSIIPDKVFQYIMSSKTTSTQCPDLFCYNKEKTDWFFCEAKGKGDIFKDDQLKYFESIELLSGKEIFFIKIDKKRSLTGRAIAEQI